MSLIVVKLFVQGVNYILFRGLLCPDIVVSVHKDYISALCPFFRAEGQMMFLCLYVHQSIHTCISMIISNMVNKFTVKPVLSGHSKIDKTKILITNGSLMKVKSIAECSL